MRDEAMSSEWHRFFNFRTLRVMCRHRIERVFN